MTTAYDSILACLNRCPTMINGLKWFPSLEPAVNNDQDWPPFGFPNSAEITDCNLMVVKNALDKLGDQCRSILEIGVDRNGSRSFTNLFLRAKSRECVYVGVDLDDKSHIRNVEQNQHFLQANSHNQQQVRQFLQNLGVTELDILMIDGWHSVNTAVNDWSYTDLLSDHGIVLLHDTNAHPGPAALFDAVDETVWRKFRFCTQDDMGIAVFSKVRKGD